MLRCGQMVLAEALINLHLGRDWFWTRETKDPTYLKILHRFEDNAKSPFSIHQIALMGDSEDKKVGEWFGPNTIAQVLKKIVKYDDFCSIVIHVALDSTIATDEVYELCETITETESLWSPLLLIIPLRLGLSEINPIYIEALKKCFQLPGSCGMIGGRPNQALYFIGFVGDEALYLDPHTLQRAGCVGGKLESYEIELDETYHQKYANRINFKSMDPSLALCFLCRTKTEFVELLGNFNREIIDKPDIQSLFEIITKRSVPWFSPPGSGSSSAMRSSVDQDQFVDCENLLEGENFECLFNIIIQLYYFIF